MKRWLLVLLCGWGSIGLTNASPAQTFNTNQEVTSLQQRRKDVEINRLKKLLGIRTIYVDEFTGGEAAPQIRDMVIASLYELGLFLITEDPQHADAILRGSAEDLIYEEDYATSEGVSARTAISLPLDTSSSSSSRSRRTYASMGVGEDESLRKTERRHEASIAVRLVSPSGEVLWSTTQHSRGAKFRSASADVAYRVARELEEALKRAWQLTGQESSKDSPAGPRQRTDPEPDGKKPASSASRDTSTH